MTDEGRRLQHGNRRVRLSDCGPDGLLRLDGVARYLQDIGSDDWDDVGAGSEFTWVVRRIGACVWRRGGRWPRLGEWVQLIDVVRWYGRRMGRTADQRARRRGCCRNRVLWVPVNASGQPQRIPS